MTFMIHIIILFLSIGMFCNSAMAYPAARVLGVTQPNYPKAMHHGVAVRIDPIDDPNLTAFHVQVSKDGGSMWVTYDDNIRPIDGDVINLPYRGNNFVFKTGESYKIRVCAVYGLPATCLPYDASVWSEGEILLAEVDGDGTDEDLDYMTEREEYNLGIDPLNPDSDDDDAADHIEIAAGLDPTVTDLPVIEVNPFELAFGSGNPWGDYTDQHEVVTIRNSGLRPLRIFNIIVEDDPPGSFQVNNRIYDMTEIPPMGEVEVPIDFIPKGIEPATGTLYILSDDSRHYPVGVSLVGNGASNIANLDVDMSPIDFARVAVGGSSETRTVVVTNPSGDVPLELSAFAVDSIGFAVSPNNLLIQPGTSAGIDVTFTPDWAGEFQGYLRIQGGNDVERKVVKIPLVGRGMGDEPLIRVVRNHVSFGKIRVGREKREEIRIYNDGQGMLYVRMIDQGMDEGLISKETKKPPFRISSRSFTVPPGGSRPVEVIFQPQEEGNFGSQLCIISNDSTVTESIRGCDIPRSTSAGDPIDGGSVHVMLYGSGQ